jgi:hypothetical protein
MNIDPRKDLQDEYKHIHIDDAGGTVEECLKLPCMFIRNVELLQEWYQQQLSPNYMIWFELNAKKFSTWKNLQVFSNIEPEPVPDPVNSSHLSERSTGSGTNGDAALFLRSIKRSPTDYNKFKDDNKWKQWHRHLRATARSHGLSNVLDPTYKPETHEDTALFDVQNTFMYSVFEQCLHTTKSRHVVQSHDATANAQLVYAGLISAYEETLTTSLAATDLRAELTLLRFDDNWKKGSEAFLLHWQGKILELEQLEDKAIDDATKRLWLTATLSTKAHMSSSQSG